MQIDFPKIDNRGFFRTSNLCKGFALFRQMLLARGAGVDAMDKHGNTALIYASKNGHEKIQDLLIKAGTSIDHFIWYLLNKLNVIK